MSGNRNLAFSLQISICRTLWLLLAVSTYIGLEIEVTARRGNEEAELIQPPSLLLPWTVSNPVGILAPGFRVFNLQPLGSYNEVRDEHEEEKTQASKSATVSHVEWPDF